MSAYLSAFICVPDAHGEQKRESEALELELIDGNELSCGSWNPNLSPLQEQPVLVAAEGSLQSI